MVLPLFTSYRTQNYELPDPQKGGAVTERIVVFFFFSELRRREYKIDRSSGLLHCNDICVVRLQMCIPPSREDPGGVVDMRGNYVCVYEFQLSVVEEKVVQETDDREDKWSSRMNL